MDPAKWAAWRSGPAATGDQRQHQRRLRAASRHARRLGLAVVVRRAAISRRPGGARYRRVAGARHDFPVGGLAQLRTAPVADAVRGGHRAAGGGHPGAAADAARWHHPGSRRARCQRRAAVSGRRAAGAGRHAAGRRAPGRGQRARGDGDAGAAALARRRGAAARVDGRRQAVPAGVGRQAEPAARPPCPAPTSSCPTARACCARTRPARRDATGRWRRCCPRARNRGACGWSAARRPGPRIHAPSASTRAPAMWCWPTRTMPRASWTTSRS